MNVQLNEYDIANDSAHVCYAVPSYAARYAHDILYNAMLQDGLRKSVELAGDAKWHQLLTPIAQSLYREAPSPRLLNEV